MILSIYIYVYIYEIEALYKETQLREEKTNAWNSYTTIIIIIMKNEELQFQLYNLYLNTNEIRTEKPYAYLGQFRTNLLS